VNNSHKKNQTFDHTENTEPVTSEDKKDPSPSTMGDGQETIDPLEIARKQADEYLEALQRLKAEFDNFRKRMAKERQKLAEIHQAVVLEAVLPALDSFDAALKQPGSDETSDVYQGLKLIYDVLMRNLEALGFHRMELLNTHFDPEISEAIMVQQTDSFEPNTVIGEISAGYRFRNSVLRPARVVVSVSPGAPADSTAGDSDTETQRK
jgi:molecular chaperone GrpE